MGSTGNRSGTPSQVDFFYALADLCSDPACGTCRKKSRRCDRGRPHCQRCISKGLLCDGYATRFKIYDLANNGGKARATATRASKRKTNTNGITKSSSAEPVKSPVAPVSQNQESPIAVASYSSAISPVSNSNSYSSRARHSSDHLSPRLDDILASDETTALLHHCT